MVIRLNRIEPDRNDKCPVGYEYVHGHREHSGKYVRDFCRKIPPKRIKLNFDMKYPGETKVKVSARQGIHGFSESMNVDTEELLDQMGEQGKDMRKFMASDWKKGNEFGKLEDKGRKR